MAHERPSLGFAFLLAASLALATLSVIVAPLQWLALFAVLVALLACFVGHTKVFGRYRLPGVLIGIVNALAVAGIVLWPLIVSFTVKPWDTDVVRACSDALGRGNITSLEMKSSVLPPALLCYPDGWESWPVSATPVVTTVFLLAAFFVPVGLSAVSACVAATRARERAA